MKKITRPVGRPRDERLRLAMRGFRVGMKAARAILKIHDREMPQETKDWLIGQIVKNSKAYGGAL